MELKKINYKSAVFFSAAALVMYLLVGILQVIVARDPAFVALYGAVNKMLVLVYTPLLGAVVTYLFMVLMIFVYNLIAQKYPISWTIKK